MSQAELDRIKEAEWQEGFTAAEEAYDMENKIHQWESMIARMTFLEDELALERRCKADSAVRSIGTQQCVTWTAWYAGLLTCAVVFYAAWRLCQ